MKFFIFGHGSIGSRHQKNLIDLGHREVFDLKTADCALICNPTAKHLETAKQAHGLPLFIEKPLSHNLVDTEKLTGKILVGYCLRFDRTLREFKKKIDQLKVRYAKIVCQSYLPDWHPEKDYRLSYSAKKALGGGVLLDLSHEIDYALWFFGPVKTVSAKLRQSPELNIETEAIADLKLEFVSGVHAEIHLSYASRKAERYCEVMTVSGSFRWDFRPNNEMYVSEMKHFVNVVTGKEAPLVTVADGIAVLKVIEAARRHESI